MDEIYQLIGKIVEQSQRIEYGLACVICFHDKKRDVNHVYEKIKKCTLGELLEEARKIQIFEEQELGAIENSQQVRNKIVHDFFKLSNTDTLNNEDYLRNNITSFLGEELDEMSKVSAMIQNKIEAMRSKSK